jgi:hypothetical protein
VQLARFAGAHESRLSIPAIAAPVPFSGALVTSLWELESSRVKSAAEIEIQPNQRNQNVMNKKYLFLSTTVLVAAGLVWVGQSVYRARHNLVTLDVYNAPLASVIKQMERQTRETILAGKGLDAKVTLAVKNMPLEEALNRLGQQVGANWSKWHAVHGSESALNQLEAALRDRTKIEDAGWTNIAPQDFMGGPGLHGSAGGSENSSVETGGGGAVVTRGKPVVVRLNSSDIKNGDVQAALREKLKEAGADEAVIARPGSAMQQQTMDVDVQASGSGGNLIVKKGSPQPRIRMVTRSRDANGEVIEEIWSPERVVLEQRLQPKLGDQTYQDASEAVAREISEKVKGNLTTLYVLRKSPGGFPFAGRMMRQVHVGAGGGTNIVASEPPPMPDIESAVKRAEAENYTRLTPEQRVQRAREKKAAKTNP